MSGVLSRRGAVTVFLAFALAYFFAALVRAITATLSPTLTQEFALHAGDLGLLAGGYFLGFSATQLPLGNWLDRHGPKKVILCFLGVSAVGCVAFSLAGNFAMLLAARVLCGAGLSACLMAPLTGYRRWLEPVAQQRANSWMLMTGSLGMIGSTLPVQWLVPKYGWRPLFWGLALLIVVAMAVIAWRVPRWQTGSAAPAAAQPGGALASSASSYAEIWRHPYFRRAVPLGFIVYGGLLSMQTLWAGPWLVKVAGYTPLEAAGGLFWINVSMLCAFWTWGLVNPWLMRRGFTADRLIARGLPLHFAVMLYIVAVPGHTGAIALALYCLSCTVAALMQPAVGLVFAPSMAGRALSAFNLVIFSGVFILQWGIGLLIDMFQARGWSTVAAFQGAMAVHLALGLAAYAWYVATSGHNRPS